MNFRYFSVGSRLESPASLRCGAAYIFCIGTRTQSRASRKSYTYRTFRRVVVFVCAPSLEKMSERRCHLLYGRYTDRRASARYIVSSILVLLAAYVSFHKEKKDVKFRKEGYAKTLRKRLSAVRLVSFSWWNECE